jgi:membrane-associated phospholipid phosphatase
MLRSDHSSESAAWVLIAGLLLAVGALQLRAPLPIAPGTLAALITACAALGGTAIFYRRVRRQENFAVICIGLAQVLLFSAIGSILSYMLAREGGALWDARLEAWDRAIGFDWLAYVRLVDAHGWLVGPVRWAYASLVSQVIVLVLALGFSNQLATLRRMLLAGMLSGTITILLSALFPAVGHYVHDGLTLADFQHLNPWAGYAHQADFSALRSGSMTVLHMDRMQGIITFPSYHAGLATVTLWGFWASRIAWLKWPGAAVALATLFATPVDGGHYLVDVLAGMAAGMVAIALAGPAIRWQPAGAWVRSWPFRRSRAAFVQ